MGKSSGIVGAVLIGLVTVSAAASAQSVVSSYGVDSLSVEVVNPWTMTTGNEGTGWDDVANGYRYTTNAGELFGAVNLPQGALILEVELEACDTSTIGQVSVALLRCDTESRAELAEPATGVADALGCIRTVAVLGTPETVDNGTYRYLLNSRNTTSDGTTSIGAVRIVYRRQVSPAPLDPSFNDVPTSDPAFQFIEALAASGVTAGCGGGNYCPNAPLTRRQMAVFLAKLVGLHWPDVVQPNVGR